MIRAGVAVIAIVLVAASVALAAPPPGSSLQDRRVYYAEQAIDTAGKQVERDHACRRRPPESAPVGGAPSATFLGSLAALRRPARPGDDTGSPDPLGYGPTIYTGYIRVLTAPDGTTFQVFPAYDVSYSGARPKRCVDELRSRVRRAIADRPRGFKLVAKGVLRREIGLNWSPRQREGLFVLIDHSFGTLADLAHFRRQGVFGLVGDFGDPGAISYGVVPDGVATIDFTFRRFEPTGYWSKHHPVTYRTTVAVQDNVLAVHLPLTLRDAVLSRQVWRAADGHVIRVTSGG